MEFKIKISGLQALNSQLDPRLVRKAMAQTLNDLSKTVRGQTSKQIKNKYTLKASRINTGIKITGRAKVNNLVAKITFTGRPPGLHHYRAKQLTSGIQLSMGKHGMIGKKMKRNKTVSGVSLEIIKGKRKRLPHAWMMTTKAGAPGVWQRGKYSGGRFIPQKHGLSVLKGPSIKGMFSAVGGTDVAAKIINSKLSTVFDRQYKRQLYLSKQSK